MWSQWSLSVWNKMAVLTPSKLYVGTNIYILTEHALTCLHSLCAHASETSSLNANSETFVVYCRYCVWWYCWLASHQHHSNCIMQLHALFPLTTLLYIYGSACMCVHVCINMCKTDATPCTWYIYTSPPHVYMHIYVYIHTLTFLPKCHKWQRSHDCQVTTHSTS